MPTDGWLARQIKKITEQKDRWPTRFIAAREEGANDGK